MSRDWGARWGCGPALWLFGILVALILAAFWLAGPVTTTNPTPSQVSVSLAQSVKPSPTVDAWCQTVARSTCGYYEARGKP